MKRFGVVTREQLSALHVGVMSLTLAGERATCVVGVNVRLTIELDDRVDDRTVLVPEEQCLVELRRVYVASGAQLL